jgi:uncharacterized repeat protein (TIGR01451 family)
MRNLLSIAALVLLPRLAWAAPDLALQMTVDTPVPAPLQTVEFTLTLRNAGSDVATDVVVNDRLPPELAIPTGLAAFPSVGTYDAATGLWTVGTLNPGASAQLVIPAVVVSPGAPPCIANVATTNNSLDPVRSNDRAVAAVRRNAATSCVDLGVFLGTTSVPDCVTYNRASNTVRVTNFGPDEAREVLVDLSQDPRVIPGLALAGGTCTGTRCTIAVLAAGATQDLFVTSNRFENISPLTVALTVAASSADIDYSTSNNQATVLQNYRGVSPWCESGWKVSGSCFIATAAYGSPLEPHVQALRDFRDRHLRRSALGRAFIWLYEKYSPPLAAVIARHSSLRLLARAALTPLVLAVEYPRRALGSAALVLSAGAFAFGLHRRRTVAIQSAADSRL